MEGKRIQRYLLPLLLGEKCAVGKSIRLPQKGPKQKIPDDSWG